MTAGYDKGFGRPQRPGPTRHGHTPPPNIPPLDPPAAGITPPPRRPWSRHAGRVGLAVAALGGVFGLINLIATGNWAAPLVLPVLLGFSAWFIFWLASTILDAVRGV